MNDENIFRSWCEDCGAQEVDDKNPTKGCIECNRWERGWRLHYTKPFLTLTTQFVECSNCEKIFHIDDGWWGRQYSYGENVKKRKCKSCHKTCNFAEVPCGVLTVEAGELER